MNTLFRHKWQKDRQLAQLKHDYTYRIKPKRRRTIQEKSIHFQQFVIMYVVNTICNIKSSFGQCNIKIHCSYYMTTDSSELLSELPWEELSPGSTSILSRRFLDTFLNGRTVDNRDGVRVSTSWPQRLLAVLSQSLMMTSIADCEALFNSS